VGNLGSASATDGNFTWSSRNKREGKAAGQETDQQSLQDRGAE
jgi:hypothetical protein